MGVIVVFVFVSTKWANYSDNFRDWKACEQRVLSTNETAIFDQAVIDVFIKVAPEYTDLIDELRSATQGIKNVAATCSSKPTFFTNFSNY